MQGLFGNTRVFEHVVQQRCHQGLGIQLPFGASFGNLDRMRNIRLAAITKLTQMGRVADPISVANAAQVVLAQIQ